MSELGFFRQPRSAETTIACKACGKTLTVLRDCSNVYLSCKACKACYKFEDCLKHMDDALEKFMEGVYVDRV